MNTYYDRIMEYKGADELKEIVKQWEILSENLSKRPFDAPIVLPDLFMYTSPGYGNTNLLSLISDYLDSKKNLMSFYGDVKFFEFKLDYASEEREFRDLYRLIDAINAAAGFRSEYKGIIRISIDDWVGHHNEKHFLDFLQFLQINTDYWFVVLTVSDKKAGDEAKAMEAVVRMYLRIETVTLYMPKDAELVEFAETYLSKYDLKFDDSARELLEKSVAVLKENEYFNGLRTIIDLCNDIVYTVYSASTNVSHVISADMLADFRPDGDYITRTVLKSKKTVTLGFKL